MGKSLYIAEKPSVAAEFARVLDENMRKFDGYMESDSSVVTWCVGHLVTMSYPDAYDMKYKKWSLQTLPFIPEQFRYEVIGSVKKQFGIVKELLNRPDVDVIYVCTDSGREGEYIYRLVAQMTGVHGKQQRRVWIDSQTKDEILRGIREAKDLSEYDNLASAAYLRAQEDYLMGINFSRVLTLVYGRAMASCMQERYSVISVGRVMTCVLGMIVRREREIRQFVKTPFYKVIAALRLDESHTIDAEFKAVEGSAWYLSPALYKDSGFLKREDAQQLIESLSVPVMQEAHVESCTRKKEKKNPPLLFNLAELQNVCSRMFKISPDQTLAIAQQLYEKKLITYPRTDARVLSSAVAKEIDRNLRGLCAFGPAEGYAKDILERGAYKGLEKTRYVNDKQITDHYALIPTGSGLPALRSLQGNAFGVYCQIVRRFLQIFYPPAEYTKAALSVRIGREQFNASVRVLTQEGYLAVMKPEKSREDAPAEGGTENPDAAETVADAGVLEALSRLRKGSTRPVDALTIREGETTPPRRYNSGSMILAMENAGQLIEDEQLREQIRGSGIGTSATRAEILKKLVTNHYIALNKKTQILTPTLRGEVIFDVVAHSIRSLLNPELTASWEKGLTYVSEGSISSDEYMQKLKAFIIRHTDAVKGMNNQYMVRQYYDAASAWYAGGRRKSAPGGNGSPEGKE